MKLSEKMSSAYPFSLYSDEGISDLFDITLPASKLVAENEEIYFEDDLVESDGGGGGGCGDLVTMDLDQSV